MFNLFEICTIILTERKVVHKMIVLLHILPWNVSGEILMQKLREAARHESCIEALRFWLWIL